MIRPDPCSTMWGATSLHPHRRPRGSRRSGRASPRGVSSQDRAVAGDGGVVDEDVDAAGPPQGPPPRPPVRLVVGDVERRTARASPPSSSMSRGASPRGSPGPLEQRHDRPFISVLAGDDPPQALPGAGDRSRPGPSAARRHMCASGRSGRGSTGPRAASATAARSESQVLRPDRCSSRAGRGSAPRQRWATTVRVLARLLAGVLTGDDLLGVDEHRVGPEQRAA